jgi:CBS domain-containing protein
VRLITCRRDSTLRELLEVLVGNRVHRVYVVEPAGGDSEGLRPVGVVTPTDVLRLVAEGAADVSPAVQAKCMS